MNHSAIKCRYRIDGHWLEAARIDSQRPDALTIVLLHEGLGSLSHWKAFPQVLAEATGAGIFVYSRYGHGSSDSLQESRTASYMHHEAQVALPELLKQAGIVRPLLFGQSDGASIAILYAGTFPDSPCGLILEAPHVFVEDITVSSIADAREAYKQTDLPKLLGKYHANVDSMFWGWNNIWLDPSFREWNIEPYLDRIRCPILILQGAQDEYGTAAQIDAIKARIPLAFSVLLDNCKHAPHRDQCNLTISAVESFLNSMPSINLGFAKTSRTLPPGKRTSSRDPRPKQPR